MSNFKGIFFQKVTLFSNFIAKHVLVSLKDVTGKILSLLGRAVHCLVFLPCKYC